MSYAQFFADTMKRHAYIRGHFSVEEYEAHARRDLRYWRGNEHSMRRLMGPCYDTQIQAYERILLGDG